LRNKKGNILHYQNNELIITIDGPAGAGKSTVAKILAQRLGYRYINTGDLYRYVTYCALQEKLDVRNSELMDHLSKKIVDQFIKKNQHEHNEHNLTVLFDQEDTILDKIHSPEIDKNVSFVAQIPSVRKNLVSLQRLLAKKRSVVMEGRDIGSVILPNADLKFFLFADEQTRIIRRHKELQEKGYPIPFQEVKAEIIKRDHVDSKRKIAPLTIPKDAITVDTSNKNVNGIIKTVLKIVQKRGRE